MSKNKNTIIHSSLSAGGNIHIGDIVNIHQNNKKEAKSKETKTVSIDEIRNLIGKSKIKQALELLLQQTKPLDEDLYNQALHQSQRWNKLRKDETLGIISTEEGNLIRNRIVNGLLLMLDEMKDS